MYLKKCYTAKNIKLQIINKKCKFIFEIFKLGLSSYFTDRNEGHNDELSNSPLHIKIKKH